MTRVLVFEDSVYRRENGTVYTNQAFLMFAASLSTVLPDVTLLGRLHPEEGESHYALPSRVRFRGLPHYAALADPAALLTGARSVKAAWSALGQSDVVWLLGPHPLALLMAVLAPLRGTEVVLGVRQDLPRYARSRHPGKRWTHVAADVLELAWQRLARRHPVVAIGPELARRYAQTPALLELVVSLVPDTQDTTPLPPRDDGELRLLSVGRLDAEKNPLMLADVLALLHRQDDRWRLIVCGVGPLEGALRDRLEELGVAHAAELRGYVPVDAGLLETYRSCDVFLHVSWTEGVPQVLYEAWGAGVPVIATAVGGVGEVAQGAAVLIPPGDPKVAADAVLRVAGDPDLAATLVAAGRERASSATFEQTVARTAEFLRACEHAVPSAVGGH